MLKALLLISLASLPLLGRAQSTPPAVGFYAGAALSVQTGQPFNEYASTRLGPALTVGARLRSRLALQLSSAYNQQHGTYHGSYLAYGGLVVEDNDTHRYTFTLPLLLRATLNAPASRWHVDALAGPTLQVYFTHQDYLQTTQGQVTRSGTSNYVETQVSLTLGPGVRYALTPHLELAATALANLNVSGFPYTLLAPISNQFDSHVLAGVQYRFGP